MPWLGAGELLNLAAAGHQTTPAPDPRLLSRACVLSRLTVSFGAHASYSLADIPLFAGRVVAGPPLRAPCEQDLL